MKTLIVILVIAAIPVMVLAAYLIWEMARNPNDPQ